MTTIYGDAVRLVLHSPLLSLAERANLVGVGHSAGGGALYVAFLVH
jgi:hypothetical protein